jgi:hypothetical protein
MNSHPLYERPLEDQGRESRTDDWNKSNIINFLDENYDNPLKEFGVDDYDELKQRVDELGLSYDEESDWRQNQISDLGEKDFDFSMTCYPIKLEDKEERKSKPDDFVPKEVRFLDENRDIQVEYER